MTTAAYPTANCTTVRQWQQRVKWPPPKPDMAKLDELIEARLAAAKAKCDELGLPAFCRNWVTEYNGMTARDTHLWESSLRVSGGADDIHVFDRIATKDNVWRYVRQWSDGYRMVLICPQHRLTLTYCEGDVTLVFCPSKEHFFAELRDAHLFYQRH